ncbi:MAG: TolB family protein [Candidatus Limnocylindria bacterium]
MAEGGDRPRWSSSGQWLAYTAEGSIWITDAGGGTVRRIDGIAGEFPLMRWSPTEDLLAVASYTLPSGGSLWLVRPSGAPLQLATTQVTDMRVSSLAWSRDGRLAYSATLPFEGDPGGRDDALYTLDRPDGEPVLRLTADDAGLTGLEWWPDGRGVLFVRAPMHSASLLADVQRVEVLPLGSMTPTGALPPDLVWKQEHWIDEHRFAAVVGGGRWLTTNKSLAICDIATMACAIEAGSVSLDPALSPASKQIAFVRAPDDDEVGFASETAALAWVKQRTLWIAEPASDALVPLGVAGGGVFDPEWSRDGRAILFQRDGSLWRLDLDSGQVRQLIDGLPLGGALSGTGWVYAWHR